MHHLDLSLLRTFIAVAETHSFTKAAAHVGRSQSAVTQQIQKLEETVGGALLVRGKRSVMLTPRGELLLGFGRKMLVLEEQLLTEMREGETAGEVRFGSPEDFATHYLPGILKRFTETHPRITLAVNCELTLTLLEAFARGEYDLVIIKQEPGALHPGAQPLWREMLVWAGLPDQLAALQSKESVVPLVLSPAPCVYRQRTLDALGKAQIPWRLTYTSPSLAGAIAAVRAGLGLTVLPQKIVPEGLRAVTRSLVLPELSETQICLLIRPNPAPAVQAFAEYIAALLPREMQDSFKFHPV
jgi:DNA-binding transcriptional LysR family regulator